MGRHAGLRKNTDQLLRVRKLIGDHDKCLIDPFVTDILRNIVRSGNDRDPLDHISDPVSVHKGNATDHIAGEVVFLHAFYNPVGNILGGDDQERAFCSLFHLFF